MAARKGPSYPMLHSHRDKIKNSNILTCLLEHVEGRKEMTASQVTAGLGLLKKVLPDLVASADTDDNGNLIPIKSMSDDDLEAIAAGRSRGVVEEKEGPQILN